MTDKTYLTTAQLARRWGVAQNTLRNWRQNGKGPPVFRPTGRPMGRALYALEDILAWEDKHTSSGSDV